MRRRRPCLRKFVDLREVLEREREEREVCLMVLMRWPVSTRGCRRCV